MDGSGRHRNAQPAHRDAHSVDVVASGRFGYLLKDRVFDVDDFLDALRRVGDGGSALDPEVVATLLVPRRTHDALGLLTPREREVLALMAEGRTYLGIARRLWLTDRTVETHVSSIIRKLGEAESEGAPEGDRRPHLAGCASGDCLTKKAGRRPRPGSGVRQAPAVIRALHHPLSAGACRTTRLPHSAVT